MQGKDVSRIRRRTRRGFYYACASIALVACSEPAPSDASAGSGGAGGAGGGAAASSGGTSGLGGTGGTGGAAETSGGAGGAGGVPSTGGAGGAAGVMAESGGSGGEGGVGGAGDTDASVDESTTGPFPPVTDFEAPGPYTSTMMAGVGPNSNYTVYKPTELAPGGAKNPIVVWMSGGGTDPTWYTLLPHLATHGFVVVASNTIPGIGTEDALGQELVAGIDWAVAEDTRAGGELEGKLDTTKIASVGYSMGSLATFMMAMDERLTTTVHISGGNMAPERVNNLHAPAAFICGIPGPETCGLLDSTCDIAAANCATDFENATTPVFYATFESGHLGIMTAPFDVQIAGLTTEWLRYHLMGDTTRKPSFVGADCAYCSDTDWEIQQKNLD